MIISAFSINEAKLKAKKYFTCDENELKIYVIKPPCIKFLGLYKRSGKYKIEYQANFKTDKNLNKEAENGSVAIINGKVKVKNPSFQGRYASLIANNPNIEVYLNNKKVHGPVIVTEKDNIEFKGKTVSPFVDIKVEISEDKLTATLTIIKKPGRIYYVEDVKENNSIYIRSNYNKIYPPKITLEKCIEELIVSNIKTEYIDFNAIIKLLNQQHGGISIVAKGIPPVHGIDSIMKYLFENNIYRNPDFDTDKKIDLLNHTIIPTVDIGEVLAIKEMPAIPGKNGESVTGDILKAKKPRDMPLKAGKGAILFDNETKIIAVASGRPVLQDGIVSVIPSLIISHDVNVDTGNVNFDGDILIKGNVLDNIAICAQGDITILGDVLNANIISQGNIRIQGNIISSKVRAGIDVVSYLCVLPKIKKIDNILTELVSMEKTKNPSVDKILNIGTKINKIIEDIKKLLNQLASEDIEPINTDLKDLLNETQKILVGINITNINSYERIKLIKNKIDKYLHKIEDSYGKKTDIIFEYAQNSNIQANGNIKIQGKGCYRTNLIAKNSIIFNHSKSIVRGGILIAGENIKAGIIGSPAGIATYCKVLSKDGKISTSYCYDNASLYANNKLIIAKDQSNPTSFSVQRH